MPPGGGAKKSDFSLCAHGQVLATPDTADPPQLLSGGVTSRDTARAGDSARADAASDGAVGSVSHAARVSRTAIADGMMRARTVSSGGEWDLPAAGRVET
jgi:hypothetical protein